ncbi:putative syntaxin binding protein [Trypanosoma cruzi]|nr:putative syntaxin binding protein [Trypanosoma cruzi]
MVFVVVCGIICSIRCLTPFMDRLKFFCDAHATSVLSCSLRLHDLMEHGVTLLEDLMTPRQPIISSPAPYFFAVEDASVSRVAEDWIAKVPYRDAHIFALGCTPHRHPQQLACSDSAEGHALQGHYVRLRRP